MTPFRSDDIGQPAVETPSSGIARRRYLSAEEAADYLNVSPGFIRRAATERRLRHLRVGRFVRFEIADLDAFVEVREPTTGPDPQTVTEVWRLSRGLAR